jgi:hypothetical protein
MGRKKQAGTMKAKVVAETKEIIKEKKAEEAKSTDKGFEPCTLPQED